jgi:preprotein translocase subunit SecF
MNNFNLLDYKKYFLAFSGGLVIIAIVLISIFGFKPGIDLQGGAEWAVKSGVPEFETKAAEKLTGIIGAPVTVRHLGDGTAILRLPSTTETEHRAYETKLKEIGEFTEIGFTSVGPTIGVELRNKAITAMILVLLAISLYIAFSFRKASKPITSWKYGLVTLVTLAHDVIIPAGMLAVLGKFLGIEMDTNSIVALLVVMGFSVHDTIVVFDRIREHLVRGETGDLGALVNRSVRETFVRSINTSLTLVLVLVALLIWGPESMFYFTLTILVGTVFGTYSSIFVASPLLYLWGRGGSR